MLSSSLADRLNSLPARTVDGGWVTITTCVAGTGVTLIALVVTARPRAGRLDLVIGPGRGQRQARERRHAPHGLGRQGADQARAAGVGQEGQGDRAGEARDGNVVASRAVTVRLNPVFTTTLAGAWTPRTGW